MFNTYMMMVVCYKAIINDNSTFEFRNNTYRITDRMFHYVYFERHIMNCINILMAFLLIYFNQQLGLFEKLIMYFLISTPINIVLLYIVTRLFNQEINKQS